MTNRSSLSDIAGTFKPTDDIWDLAGRPWLGQYNFEDQYPQSDIDADWANSYVFQELQGRLDIFGFVDYYTTRMAGSQTVDFLDCPTFAIEVDPIVKTGASYIKDGVHYIQGTKPIEYIRKFPPSKVNLRDGYQWTDEALLVYGAEPPAMCAVARARTLGIPVCDVRLETQKEAASQIVEVTETQSGLSLSTRSEKRASRVPKPGEKGEVECYRCGQLGHMRANCPQKSAPRGRGGRGRGSVFRGGHRPNSDPPSTTVRTSSATSTVTPAVGPTPASLQRGPAGQSFLSNGTSTTPQVRFVGAQRNGLATVAAQPLTPAAQPRPALLAPVSSGPQPMLVLPPGFAAEPSAPPAIPPPSPTCSQASGAPPPSSI